MKKYLLDLELLNEIDMGSILIKNIDLTVKFYDFETASIKIRDIILYLAVSPFAILYDPSTFYSAAGNLVILPMTILYVFFKYPREAAKQREEADQQEEAARQREEAAQPGADQPASANQEAAAQSGAAQPAANQREEAAATKIQAIFRGRNVRKASANQEAAGPGIIKTLLVIVMAVLGGGAYAYNNISDAVNGLIDFNEDGNINLSVANLLGHLDYNDPLNAPEYNQNDPHVNEGFCPLSNQTLGS